MSKYNKLNKKNLVLIVGISEVGKTSLCQELEDQSKKDNKFTFIYSNEISKFKRYLLDSISGLSDEIMQGINKFEDLIIKIRFKTFLEIYQNAALNIISNYENNEIILFDCHMFYPIGEVFYPILTYELVQTLRPKVIVILLGIEDIILKRRQMSHKPIAKRTIDNSQIEFEQNLEFIGAISLSLKTQIPIIIHKGEEMNIEESTQDLSKKIMSVIY